MDVLIRYEVVFFFCECLLSESVLFFTKETAKYQYEDSEEDSQDTENKEEEEKFNKKQGPEKDVDPAESRP